MNTLQITVWRRWGDGWPVAAELGATDDELPRRLDGVLRLDPAALRPLEHETRAYGTLLGRELFREEVRDAFAQALARAAESLRVLLFVEDAELRPLRWERLCAPLDGVWDFLALNQRVLFAQHLPSAAERRFPPISWSDLRALAVVASPVGLEAYRLAPFDASGAAAGVRGALGRIECDVLGSPGVEGAVGPPTLDALCTRLAQRPDAWMASGGRYTLLHLVCHGRFVRGTGETVVYLADEDGRVDPVTGTRLVERLRRATGPGGLPRFAFLATCEGARPEAEAQGALGGLAQRLVRELGLPAVVAMTEPVPAALPTALAAAFYPRLERHGEPDRALAEAWAGLAGRPDAAVAALYSRLGGRPLFKIPQHMTRRGAGLADFAAGLGRVARLFDQRAPALRPAFDGPAATYRRLVGTRPGERSAPGQEQERWFTALRAAGAELDALCLEAIELEFNDLALGEGPPPYDARCPFRGLEPFRPEDRAFFFGREALVARLAARLRAHPFLAVLGPSGSGKSSLVLAGLIPALEAAEPGLRVAYLTPGGAPVARLEAGLAELAGAAGRPALLVVDQFEELFALCRDGAARRAFLDRLLALREGQQPRVVLTMRADFWGECAPYPTLREVVEAEHELVAPLDAAALRRAAELQAAAVGPPGGLRFEADLGATLLEDAREEPEAMPLVQHVLLELWKRRRGRWLGLDEYRAAGGVRRAIARTAEAVYEDASPADRARLRDVFLRLTRSGDAAAGATAPYGAPRGSRRRVALADLARAAGAQDETRALVARLVDARLVTVTTSRDETHDRAEVAVAHEALIGHWPRLQGWLDEDRAARRRRMVAARLAAVLLAVVLLAAAVAARLAIDRPRGPAEPAGFTRADRPTVQTAFHPYDSSHVQRLPDASPSDGPVGLPSPAAPAPARNDQCPNATRDARSCVRGPAGTTSRRVDRSRRRRSAAGGCRRPPERAAARPDSFAGHGMPEPLAGPR